MRAPRVLVVALLSALLLTMAPAAQAAGPYPPPSDGGSGEVSDTRVEAGECLVFTGSGFAPFTLVTIRDNGEVVGTTRTDADGDFRYEHCMSADARTGRHVLTGTGMGADGRPLTVHATFYVTGVSQRPGSSSGGSPGSAGPGGQGAQPAPDRPGASATPTPPPGTDAVPRTGALGKNVKDGGLSGLATAAITISLLLLLALLAALLLLLEKRRRDQAAADDLLL